MSKSIVVITGSRSWDDYDRILSALAEYPDATVVHGGASGADMLANRAAQELALPVQVYSADWGRHGRAAGPIRNRAMLDLNPSVVLAFWDGSSVGTADCIREARRRGLPVRVWMA